MTAKSEQRAASSALLWRITQWSLLLTACCLLLARMTSMAEMAAGNDKTLYQDSIQATKQSIADETLGIFYHDALDYYHEKRYDDALQLLDKIYSINPHYQDVESLRQTIHKKMQNTQTEQNMGTIRDWMKKGDDALHAGQRVAAVSFWKQALTFDPNYAPAKKKIQEVNQALAKKEFEAGYIHHQHGELEDALDSWSNAIALDPTYKQRGLLLLMSKVESQVKRDKIARLAAQGYDQYQQSLLEDSLKTYEELSALEPRHEEARRMTAKIKIQLGQAALKAAQTALSKHAYKEAMAQADKTVQYGYEVSRAEAIKAEAEHALQVANQPKPVKKEEKPAVAASSATTPTAPAAQAVNPEEAQAHYRKGLAAMRNKDYHLALQELDIASQQDATDEHIYMARQRAQQEWSSATNGGGTQ
jgi:tetratricopeptide (TPR) repeat protein